MSKSLVLLNDIYSFRVDGYVIKMKNKILQYYEFENCFIARIEGDKNNLETKEVTAISYFDNKFKILWEFPYNHIISIAPTKLEPFYEEGVMFSKDLSKFKGKELIQIYSNDKDFLVDVNSGEIYSSKDSR